MNHQLQEIARNSLNLSRMFGNAGMPCFHPISIEVSTLCVHFGDGFAYIPTATEARRVNINGNDRKGRRQRLEKQTTEISHDVGAVGCKFWIF